LREKLFADTSHGNKFDIYVTLTKFNLVSGSKESMALLRTLIKMGSESEIFTTKCIVDLLKLKMRKVRLGGYRRMIFYCIYLSMISFTQNVYVMVFWLMFLLVNESILFWGRSPVMQERFESYLTDVWNLL